MSETQTASVPELPEREWGERIGYKRTSLNMRTTPLPAPPAPADFDTVATLRKKLKMSQAIFAATLNVSPKVVQKWERGGCKPERAELRLIDLLLKHRKVVIEMILPNDAEPNDKTAGKNKAASKKKSAR